MKRENVISLEKYLDRSVYKQDAYTRMQECLENFRKELNNPFLGVKVLTKLELSLYKLEEEIKVYRRVFP